MGRGGPGRIPFEAIDRYAARYGIEDFEEFHALIEAADTAFVRRLTTRSDG